MSKRIELLKKIQEILSLDDIEEWLRINEMSKSIKSESIVKMLEE